MYFIGPQLRMLRESLNLSQTELANRLGFSKQTLSNWENDYAAPSIEALVKLANFFHCTTDYLLELDDHRRVLLETSNLTANQLHFLDIIVSALLDENNC